MSDLVLHQPRDPEPIHYLGIAARADLLPKEVRDRVATRAARRLAVLVIVLAIALVGAGYALAYTFTLSSQSQLAAAQSRTTELTAKESEFQSVRDVQHVVSVGSSALRVATGTAIEWAGLMAHVTAPKPGDLLLGAVAVTTQSPISSVAPLGTPLSLPRIGQIQLTGKGPDLAAIADWIDALKADPTFSGVTASTVVDTGGWIVTLTISVSPVLTAPPAADEEASP